MTATISYEVHVMRDGRWVTSGIYQDKNEALRDVHGPMRKRYLGLRVIEEIFDPDRDRFVTRTIYRSNSPSIQCGPRNKPSVAPLRAAVTMSGVVPRAGAPLKAVAMTMISVSAFLLVVIGGLFWLDLV